MTLIELIEQETARLTVAGVSFGHGTDNAFDDAAWMTLWRLGLPLDALDEHEQDSLTSNQIEQVKHLVDERIKSRKPVNAVAVKF